MASLVIHCEPQVSWQAAFADRMQQGLKALGIYAPISNNRQRESEFAILLGTTCWRNIEASGRYLLVDRASFGDPDYVQLVWDGHGRRGNHCVPDDRGRRKIAPELWPWKHGKRIVLCGQTETYSPHFRSLGDWYASVCATHFRKHPQGDNPTNLPTVSTWEDCGVAITLNSSVGVDCIIRGIPVVTMDEGAMAWDVSGHDPAQIHFTDRAPWLEWLSWTQWHQDEIRDGEPIRHLFEDVL